MKKDFKKIYTFISFTIFGLFLNIDKVFAQAGEIVKLENPIGAGTDLNTILGGGVKVALGVVGSVTLAVFMYGGFLWMTSAGNQEKIKKGWNTMIYAVVGLFIIFSSYAILNMVLSGITGDSLNGGGNNPELVCKDIGDGFSCRNIGECDLPSLAFEDVDLDRGLCEQNPNTCKVNLCKGGNNIVCCKTREGNSKKNEEKSLNISMSSLITCVSNEIGGAEAEEIKNATRKPTSQEIKKAESCYAGDYSGVTVDSDVVICVVDYLDLERIKELINGDVLSLWEQTVLVSCLL
ncbi:MAG: pilin [Candidatus Magasanikbacteria bacterium]|nr:pilin [Candidatus Magasanikbacteria bacterium]